MVHDPSKVFQCRATKTQRERWFIIFRPTNIEKFWPPTYLMFNKDIMNYYTSIWSHLIKRTSMSSILTKRYLLKPSRTVSRLNTSTSPWARSKQLWWKRLWHKQNVTSREKKTTLKKEPELQENKVEKILKYPTNEWIIMWYQFEKKLHSSLLEGH